MIALGLMESSVLYVLLSRKIDKVSRIIHTYPLFKLLYNFYAVSKYFIIISLPA